MMRILAAFAAVFLMALADPPSEQLPDPAQEARARALFNEIRCVVCQNESIAASQADLAHDMRMLVRGQIAEGKSNREVKDYLYNRYGNFILLKPRLSWGTALLWLGPFAIVLTGILLLALRRGRAAPLEERLSPEELKALKKLDIKAKS